MKLLIVEDDFIQAEYIETELKQLLTDVEIKRISTESKFYDFLAEIDENKPDIILLDIMLRWTDSAPDLREMPENVENEGFHLAGIRCEKKLRETKGGENIPVIIYSVIARDSYNSFIKPERTKYLNKDFDIKSLRNLILNFK